MSSGVRAALIDLWDTLAYAGWGRQLARLEEQAGVPAARILQAFVETRPARSIGTYPDAEADLAAVLAAAGLDPSPATLARLVELEAGFLAQNAKLFDDALPVLRQLRSRGIRTAVVSNCSHSTRPLVDRFGLEGEVDTVVLSFEIGAAKPDSAIYLAALERLGARPAEAVFVDDQDEYCAGAEAVGMRALLLRRDHPGHGPIEGPPTGPASFEVIRSLEELLD
jgi:putative hydrolase of the HAD superfamily